MIKYIHHPNIITDPLHLEILSKASPMISFRKDFVDGHFVFKIPENIVDNREKKEYYAGFLNEMYSLIYPEKTKRIIFEEVCKLYHIFVDVRQYQNLMKGYKDKKYIHFIKN